MAQAEASYKKLIRFSKAELFTFNPIYLDAPFFDSTGGPFQTLPMDKWLVIYDDNGIAGNAPCSKAMGELILPLIMNGESKTYEEWYDKIFWAIRNNGFASESAIELGRLDIALHDMMAKRENLPLHSFMGASRNWVHVYASGCGTSLTMKQMTDEVELFVREGYTTIKMKVATNFGTQIDNDVERIRIVRDLLGKDLKIAIDANQNWNARQANAFAQKVCQYNIDWFEEPVHSYNIEELEKLTAICPIPIAMGESMRNKYQFYSYIRAGVKHLQPIPTNSCGVRDWLSIRNQARQHGLVFTSGGFSHLTAALVASGEEQDQVEYLYPLMHRFYELMEVRPQEKSGKFILPETPGLPISLDFKLLKKMNYLANVQYIYPN